MSETSFVNLLESVNLGKIKRWAPEKTAQIVPVAFPGVDSSKTEGIDSLGVIMYIDISGEMIGSFSYLQDNISNIQNMVNGNQTIVQTLRSPYVNTNEYSGSTKGFVRGNFGTNTQVSSNLLVDENADFVAWGIKKYDRVQNLITKEWAYVDDDSVMILEHQLPLSDDIFTGTTGQPYALSATMSVKVMSFSYFFEPPGLTFVSYDLKLLQVNPDA